MPKTTRSITLLMNTSAVNQIIQKIDSKFDMLFHKRAFVHWYVSEGMEEGEFPEAREILHVLEQHYLYFTEPTKQNQTSPITIRINTQGGSEQPDDNVSQSNHAVRWTDMVADEPFVQVLRDEEGYRSTSGSSTPTAVYKLKVPQTRTAGDDFIERISVPFNCL
ncbi:hypothetical protein P879_09859 [Paragonimus westermani]|uniref:Tubulin alpha n=1 Tax=Paragonimus westermani TaxID=34504 RepID=A0A8T0DE94_9TREM|nr:hypothetical protein P879_09859 [Paragonimus westermani]